MAKSDFEKGDKIWAKCNGIDYTFPATFTSEDETHYYVKNEFGHDWTLRKENGEDEIEKRTPRQR